MNNTMSPFFSNSTQEAATGDPVAKATPVTGGDPSETKNSTAEKNSFTYDEGNGVKDTVKLTGPLSEVYTRMLNQSLAKKDPLEGEVETAEGTTAVSVESEQTEGVFIETALTTVLNNDHTRESINAGFNFVDDRQLTDKVDIIAHVANATTALKSETVFELSNTAEESKKKTILVVVADPAGITQGMKLNKKFMELADDSGVEKLYGDDVTVAAEALYKPFGVDVVFGIEGLIQALKKKD